MDFLKNNKYDVLIFSVLLVFCFFSFQQGDILHTGGSSIAYLNGHITDFYEENLKALGGNNYLPSTYIIFALWNLPLKLFGIVDKPTMEVGFAVFWYKLLPTIFYFATAVVLYKIGRFLSLNKLNSFLLIALWVSSPIAFFSQFIFGQYDILTTFFVICGFYYYLKKNTKLFILFFGISLTFKYFPLFIFVPLLLLIEKRIGKILVKMVMVIVPILIEVLAYYKSDAFKSGVFGFSANQRLFTAGFPLEYNVTVSIVAISMLLICALAYWKNIENDRELHKWSIYIPMVVLSIIFSFIIWHPQWLLLVTPFLALTTFLHKRSEFFLYLDIVMMYFFVAFTVNFWSGHIDQELWKLGVFKNVNDGFSVPFTSMFMKDIFIPNNTSLFFSLISGCFLLNIILKYPKDESSFIFENQELTVNKNLGLIRIRFILGIMIFIIPATICLLAPNSGKPLYDIKTDASERAIALPEIISGTRAGQVFKANAEQLNKIKINMATFARTNTSKMIFHLKQYNADSSGEVLFSKEINSSELIDNAYLDIDLNGIKVNNGSYYYFYFESDANQGNGVTIWHTPNNKDPINNFAMINNQKQNFNLQYMLFGK